MRVLREAVRDFWAWYERHYKLNVAIAASLFAFQLVHLVWLTCQPLARRVLGEPIVDVEVPFSWLIVFVDYTEIPALLSVSLVYLHDLRGGFSWRPAVYLAFLNSQWLHIFWITDEFVVTSGGDESTVLPAWLAYVAILIDYLELPVMWDTFRRVVISRRIDQLVQPVGGDPG